MDVVWDVCRARAAALRIMIDSLHRCSHQRVLQAEEKHDMVDKIVDTAIATKKHELDTEFFEQA